MLLNILVIWSLMHSAIAEATKSIEPFQWQGNTCYKNGVKQKISQKIAACASITETSVKGKNLNQADLKGISFFDSDVSNFSFHQVDQRYSIAKQTRFSKSFFEEYLASDSNFSGAVFRKSRCRTCDFQNTKFKAAKIIASNFYQTNFQNSDWNHAFVHHSLFKNCDFRGANLKNVLWIQNVCENCQADASTILPWDKAKAISYGFIFP